MSIINKIFEDKFDSLDGKTYDEYMRRMTNEGLWDELDSEDEDNEDDEMDRKMKEDVTEIIKSGQKKILNDDTAINYVTAIYQIAVARGKTQSTFKIFRHFDFSSVRNFDAMFAYLNIPNADLSVINTESATSMKGTFYKSSFNNDSIKNWKVNHVGNFDNMFLNSSFNHPEVFDEWKSDYKSEILRNPKKQPKIDTSYEDIQNAKKEVENAFEMEFEGLTLKKYGEFISEGILDTIKNAAGNVFNKIKNLFTKTTNKLNDWFVATFNSDGEGLNAVSPASIINYFGTVKAGGPVQVLSKSSDEYADAVDTISLNNSGVYEDKAIGNEERNLATLLAMSEARGVGGYKAKAGGFDEVYQECDTERMKSEIAFRLRKPQGNGTLPLLIWGAPGIGKTHIPQSIVDAYNENITDPQKRKALIVVDCGQLASDSLSVPMPDVKSVKDRLEANGKSTEGIDDRILNQLLKTCTDAIKEDALPVYRPTGDRQADKLLDDIANGSLNPVFAKDGSVEYYEKTGDGGILMLDEFFRADVDIFAKMLTLVADRKFGNNILGSKWAIIACSNRPLDDDAVASRWDSAPGALTNRFAQIQFIPSFKSWSDWARKHGFDETTLDYFTSEVNADGEFTNWFNFDTNARADYSSRRAQSQWPSPRSWTNCIFRMNAECEIRGYSSLKEFPKDEFKEMVAMYVGSEAAEDFTEYYYQSASNMVNFSAKNIIDGKLNKKTKLDMPTRTIEIMETIQSYVNNQWNDKNQIPADKFDNICQFLIHNMPEGTSSQIVVSTMEGIVTTMGYDVNDINSLKSCPYINSMKALLKVFKTES